MQMQLRAHHSPHMKREHIGGRNMKHEMTATTMMRCRRRRLRCGEDEDESDENRRPTKQAQASFRSDPPPLLPHRFVFVVLHVSSSPPR